MKKITSKLSFWVAVGIISIAAFSIESCSKSSSGSSGPKVTSVTSGGTDTAGTSSSLTITGSNLQGASVTTTTTGVTITNVTPSSDGTTITATIAIAANVSSSTVTLTLTTSAGSTNTSVTVVGIPLIGGYLSSDSVAAGSLIAYWPFDGNANDVKGNVTANTVGATFPGTGVRGGSYQGGTGDYATLTPGAAFANLGSYSLSFWYKMAAQQPNGDPGGIFFLSGTANPNLLITEIESYAPVSGDSVKIHHGFFDVISPAYQGFTMESYDTMAIGKWIHQVTTYDGSSSTYTIYENGQPIGNNSAFGSNITPTQMWTDGTKTTPLGSLGWGTDAPVQIVIGTWPAGLYGVSPTLGSNGSFNGQLDEMRVYNKALSTSEVAALYLNGKAGR